MADPGAPYLDPSIAVGTYVAVQNATPLVSSLGELPKRIGPATMVSVGQKYDGERLQLHVLPSAGPDLDPTASAPRYRRDGVEYRIFSRGGNNSTLRRALALPALAAALGHVVRDIGSSPEQQPLADAHGEALRAAHTATKARFSTINRQNFLGYFLGLLGIFFKVYQCISVKKGQKFSKIGDFLSLFWVVSWTLAFLID